MAYWLGQLGRSGEAPNGLHTTLGVVADASAEQLLLVTNRVVETTTVNLHGRRQLAHGRPVVAFRPKYLHGFRNRLFFIKLNCACHCLIM